MRHLNDHRKLGRTSAHRIALMRNLVAALFEHGRVITTIPKAKEARRYAERVITYGKKAVAATDPAKSLHFRRLALSAMGNNKDAVKALVETVAPKYADRTGGYTRVLHAGFRLGDNGEKALFELV
jgi:large subunit ribosomal protein L17